MGAIDFANVHDTVITALKEETDLHVRNNLSVIGKWYFTFLQSNEKELHLFLPDFEIEFSKTALTYIKYFTLTFNLCKYQELNKFEGTCLINVFKYRPTINEININDYLLEHNKIDKTWIIWAKEIYTSKNSFLPVFKKNQIITTKELNKIYHSFKIFKYIRHYGLIDHPILLDLTKDLNLIFDPFMSEESLDIYCQLNAPSAQKIGDEKAVELLTKLKEKCIENSVNIKFPYSKRSHPYLNSIGTKRFNLIFNKRFFYNEPEKNDLILLPEELEQKNDYDFSGIEYYIVNTYHNIQLFEALKTFKNTWKHLELNKFLTPFPKYWFLFINNSTSKNEWVAQFKEAYPAIANNPIIEIAKTIIHELHDLNWIAEGLKSFSNAVLLFPELKGIRSKRLTWAFKNFEDYIGKIFPDIKIRPFPISIIELEDDVQYLYLNAFDVIGLVNNKIPKSSCKIFTPDFLYFSYQPWIRYHILQYRTTALIEGARKSLDRNYTDNLASIEVAQKNIIDSIKNDLKIYQSRYIRKELEIENVEFEPRNSEDLDLNSSEEVGVKDPYHNGLKKIEVITSGKEEITFEENDKVLIQSDFIRVSKAIALKKRDLFLEISCLKEIIKDDDFIKKFTQQPDSTKIYQSKLYSKGEKVFKSLKNKGLTISSKTYFIKNYLLERKDITEDTHIIPKRKIDWEIICQELSINENDMKLAFIAYYGREKQNRLQELYKLVLELFTQNNHLQSPENPKFIKEVESLVDEFGDLFKKDDEYNPSEIADTIISNVNNSLDFKEVKDLKILNNE